MNEAIIAATRFGMGAGPTREPPAGDARAALLAQIERPTAPACFKGLPDSVSIVVAYQHFIQDRKDAKDDGNGKPAEKQLSMDERDRVKAAYLAEIGARYQAALDSETPFIERLVAFWSNHFTVSGVRPVVKPMVGSFEREAIRPHITGRFEDMVLAVVRHPAMGLYLDSAYSVGPDSRVGQRAKRGVNENLGRELLELHTLGVDGGYTEEDVRALARILTGWSIAGLKAPEPGHFRFLPALHEPGEQRLLGRIYAQDGEAQGEAAIRDICRHPSTARHIARKLAVHFVADDPSPETVEHLAAAFRDSGGELRAVYRALIALPEAWSRYQQKVKTPWDLVISASLATGIRLPSDQLASFLSRLGQPVYMAPQPAGWPDDAGSWVGPEAVLRRVEWCGAFAQRTSPDADPTALASAALGEVLDDDVRHAVMQAESRPTAVALLLASPQFQRR